MYFSENYHTPCTSIITDQANILIKPYLVVLICGQNGGKVTVWSQGFINDSLILIRGT